MRIIEIPIVNGLNKTKGVEEAPTKILEGFEIDSEKIEITGDLVKDNEKIYKKSFESFQNERVCFIGGDHSMSYPATRAFFDFVEDNGREPFLIIFDAHPDLMEPVDKKIPTHEEWLRALIEDGFPIKNILLVGVRNVDIHEKEFFDKIRKVTIEELMFDLETKTDSIMELSKGRDLYVSFDIDFVDPAYAPGTGYSEPGGLSSKEFLYIVKRISMMKNLKAIDIVEVNPSKDFNDLTVNLAKSLLSQFL